MSKPVSSLKSVFTVFIRYESNLSTSMSTSSFFVSVFPVNLGLTSSSANVAVRFSVDDFVVHRFFMEVASCVSVRFSPSLELEAPGVIVVSWWLPPHLFVLRWASFWVPVFMHFLYCRHCRRLWFRVSTTARRCSSDQLCSAIRRMLRAYTTPSSVLTRCSVVRLLLPSFTADLHLSDSFGAGFPFPPLEGKQGTDSHDSSNFPRYGPPVAGCSGDSASLPLKPGRVEERRKVGKKETTRRMKCDVCRWR